MTINMNVAIDYMIGLKNRGVKYSMNGSRDGSDGTGDCSGTVVRAIEKAGASRPSWLYNTDSMHDWLLKNGFELVPQNPTGDTTIQRGDVFIWGVKGQSNGAAGHTGIVYDNNEKIIHCNYAYNGVTINDHDTIWVANGKPKVYFYRLKTQGTAPSTQRLTVQVNGLNVRNSPSLSGKVVGTYNKGATWTLPKAEQFSIADGYVWARCPIGYCAVGRNTGKAETDDFIFIL